MLTEKQLAVIDEYVDDKYFYNDRLIKYLNMHTIVGNEVFDYVDRKNRNLNHKEAHSAMLDDENGYEPVSVETFVRRIPFYFYTSSESLDINEYHEDIGDVLREKWREIKTGEISLESLYEDFEYMFYQKNISPYYIFNYIPEQTNLVTEEYFMEWVEYLHLCDQLGKNDTMPKNFITTYNETREAAGLEPMIFIPYWDAHCEKPYERDGKTLIFEGVFPCDDNGQPIMKWIGLKIRNGARIIGCTCEKAKSGKLILEINPKTVIFYRDTDEGEEFWNQVYAGPLTMEFDHTALKFYRERLKYTQQEVADAVGANLRTYQKWEYGTTQPDGYYLLRLINWLDIPSVQATIEYDVPED